MNVEIISELDKKHDAVTNNEVNELEKMKEELEYLDGFIKKFFSDNGSASNIRKMYIALDSDNVKDKTCTCCFIKDIDSIYKEYMHGMVEFISDVNKLNDLATFNNYHEKFLKASENDFKFIESLFDGKITENKVIDIAEASENIEYLIDLIPFMKNVVEKCNQLYSSLYTSTNKDKTDLINNCMKMLYNSIRNYCYMATKEVIKTYININNIINGVVDNKPDNNKFALF